jgi:hypothetical protein
MTSKKAEDIPTMLIRYKNGKNYKKGGPNIILRKKKTKKGRNTKQRKRNKLNAMVINETKSIT